MTGTVISHYLLKEELGKGSMGVVYKAEDTRLGRLVAVKVLPQQLAADPVAAERFHREARAASSLNHPNICTIYGDGEDKGRRYIVMELLEGQTLSRRIDGKPLDPMEILNIAIPLASALQAAHEQGTIHRDIKSANIFLTTLATGGTVPKISDFGLSKLIAATTAADVPLTGPRPNSRAWQTVQWSVSRRDSSPDALAYMSPEQTRLLRLDARTDLFSFGVVLYHMATGRLPFQGQTKDALFRSIRNQAVQPINELNPRIPRELAKIIDRALQKDPDQRYRSAADMESDLKKVLRQLEEAETRPPHVPFGRRSISLMTRRRPLWIVAVAAVIVLAAVLGLLLPRFRARDTKPLTFTQLTDQPEQVSFPSLSPDGKSFIYTASSGGRSDIYLQRVGGKNRINLTAPTTGDRLNSQAVYSPDGEQIAFRSEGPDGGIFVMGATGEALRRVVDIGYNPSWSPDGRRLVFSSESVERPEMRPGFGELWRVDIATGDRSRIYAGDAVQPSCSPHGNRIAFWHQMGGQRDVATIPSEGGAPVQVTHDAFMDWNPVWSPDGKYLYFASDRGGAMNIWRVRIDERSGKVLGELESVATPSQDSSHLSFSKDGTRMVYVRRAATQNFQAVAFDPVARHATGAPAVITRGARQVMNPDISPDSQSITFVQWGKTEDIGVMKIDGTGMRQLTDDVYKDRGPRWSPDGSRIAFYSNRTGKYQVWMINPDGSGLKQLTNAPRDILYPVWSPDGKRIVYSVQGDVPGILSMDSFQIEPLSAMKLPDGWYEIWSWSVDGKTLAGVERTPNGKYIAVITYDLASGRIEHLTDHGTYPAWMKDNRTLLFPHADKLYALDTRTKEVSEAFSLDPAPVSRLFALSPDNRVLLFGLPLSEADIWMASSE
jgi:Tol biopolymer transport system component